MDRAELERRLRGLFVNAKPGDAALNVSIAMAAVDVYVAVKPVAAPAGADG
jgi:hypothetical protein